MISAPAHSSERHVAATAVTKPRSDDSYILVSLPEPDSIAAGCGTSHDYPHLPSHLSPIHLTIRPSLLWHTAVDTSPQHGHNDGHLKVEKAPTTAGAAVSVAKTSLQVLRVLAASQPIPFVRGIAEMALSLVEVAEACVFPA